MTNEKLKTILHDCSHEGLTQVGTGLIHQRVVDYEQFAQQIVGETILAVLATDLRDVTYTTHDRDQIHGIISRVIDQVKNHWNFKQG